jgi:hypothetical protein
MPREQEHELTKLCIAVSNATPTYNVCMKLLTTIEHICEHLDMEGKQIVGFALHAVAKELLAPELARTWN